MATFHVIAGASETPKNPAIRKIGLGDLRQALVKGWDDFAAFPSQALFIILIYPIVGFVLLQLAIGNATLPLIFPLIAGFALVGPLAAVGLYELSRRRELGLDTHWTHAFDVLRNPSIFAIAALGIVLLILFSAWMVSAHAIYMALMGPYAPDSIQSFLHEVLTTRAGWMLIAIGNAVGFVFAVVVLAIGAISFPMLVDRDVGAAAAVWTSIRTVIANPVTMAIWGFIVGSLLLLGSLPFFVGLAVVMPLLGHASWHLYRRAVAR
ncbi:MAG: DUF2189 domain-containing protein [Xanthobacteraceae bacterium]|nr:DUF2189 domain-containing protein [Xanthobacteraceae bacterium]